ncbi:tail fiber assembly protein [Gilliamella apicola]|uniref:Tail fiber assembly protein n=1 Tax=Gilliamella apicola TaxID=1196095 RepID=A0A2V4E9Y9_9GAMM|nr:tail fiber assembly protein [Gilliamella apicola]PXZ05770.1 hypothetical protein DKK79_03595 [Gilliamella apicola]PXZ07901.1 hypothetical protein DKK70_04385 [Gilliamella apicola]
MSIYYNSKNNCFYDSNINEVSSDSIKISSKYHFELLEKQSQGFVIKSDANGYPFAVESVLTADEIIMINTSKQQQLLNVVNAEIDILNRSVRLRRATDADKKRLELLENYSIDLYELDLSNPDVVIPEKP